MDVLIGLSLAVITLLVFVAGFRWLWHFDDESTSAERVALHQLRGELDRLTYRADGKVRAEQARREIFREMRGGHRD